MLIKAGAVPANKNDIPFKLPLSQVSYVNFVISSVYCMNAGYVNGRIILIDLAESSFDYSGCYAKHIISLNGLHHKTLIKLLSEQTMMAEKEINTSLIKNICLALIDCKINKLTIPNKIDPIALLRSLKAMIENDVKPQIEWIDVFDYIFTFRPSDQIVSALRGTGITFKRSEVGNLSLKCPDTWTIMLVDAFGSRFIKRLLNDSSKQFAKLCMDYKSQRINSV
jgi:hypothetical protein